MRGDLVLTERTPEKLRNSALGDLGKEDLDSMKHRSAPKEKCP